jgi:hypothetical protein
MPDDIITAANSAFRLEAAAPPAVTLRAGVALDEYRDPPPFDPVLDAPTDDYLERYAFDGITFLDAASWRHYLPLLIDYTMRHLGCSESMVVEALLWSLRPPDRTPPRLASLTAEQEAAVVAFLDRLVFGSEPMTERDFARQVMEEWWVPRALYRDDGGGAAVER